MGGVNSGFFTPVRMKSPLPGQWDYGDREWNNDTPGSGHDTSPLSRTLEDFMGDLDTNFGVL